ncbi:PREDICTED: uncharacterized protein LOC109148275 isoform X2 [Ipomoea nil]|uniref:uncharacterized protein LOC109148275 isoform X2 n=1 Tax=Ipomoea nil TaxID=35883 RepID=UPI00090196E4|nr:PREDICTED: uncharacterized protein LOC109148275 isoform X2 [Ipomoea nil]
MAASVSTVSLKLLIDKKTRKVIFAEADKSFVDFLFHLMSLPLGTVIKLVNESSMVGSLGNLYGSIKNISQTFLQPNVNKGVLLNPKVVATHSFNAPLLLAAGNASEANKFYYCNGCCSSYGRCRFISDDPTAICPQSKSKMSTEASYVAPVKADSTSRDESGGGFVKGVVTYMVTDDLKVMPHSTISTITVYNDFNIKDFRSVEVKDVRVGVDEGLKVLKAALHTDSVLTIAFLGK